MPTLIQDSTSDRLNFRLNSVTTTDYTFSIYLKNNGASVPNMQLRQTEGSQEIANFDLDNGVLNTPPDNGVGRIEDYGNGWYKVSLSISLVGNDTFWKLYLENTDGSCDVFVYGAQLEALPYPTSYIPTNGTIATRGADSLTNFGSEQIIDSESGILFFEGSALSVGTQRAISLSNGGQSNSCYIYYDNNSSNSSQTNIAFAYLNNGNVECNLKHLVSDFTENVKIIAKYKSNSFELYLNGVLVDSQNIGNVLSENTFKYVNFSGFAPFYGRVRQLKHLPYNTDITTL